MSPSRPRPGGSLHLRGQGFAGTRVPIQVEWRTGWGESARSITLRANLLAEDELVVPVPLEATGRGYIVVHSDRGPSDPIFLELNDHRPQIERVSFQARSTLIKLAATADPPDRIALHVDGRRVEDALHQGEGVYEGRSLFALSGNHDLTATVSGVDTAPYLFRGPATPAFSP